MPKLVAPTLITSISKDELLPFYFVRVAERAFHSFHPATWYAPSRLEPLIETFAGTGATFAKMEPFNTFLPLQSRFLSPGDVGIVRTHYTQGAVLGVMAILGMNGPNGGWAKTIPSFCLECIREDIALCGAPFWNRTNLVPGLLLCSRHGRPLTSATCRGCIDRPLHPDRISRPGLHCGCGITPLPGSTDLSSVRHDQELELHRVTRKLLDPTYLAELTRETLSHAIQARSEQLGLIHGTTANPGRIHDFFKGHPWRPVFERVNILSQVQSTPGYLTGQLVFRNPLQSIALTHALFGNWSNVEEVIAEPKRSVHREDTMELFPTRVSYTPKNKYRKPWLEKNRDKLFSMYSQKYSEIHSANRNLTHHEITKIIGNYARNILSKESLHQAGIDVPFYKLSDDMYAQIDIDIAEQIFKKNDDLVASGYQGRIGASILLQDFGLGKYCLLKGRIPFADAALALCTTPNLPRPLTTKTEHRSAPRKRTRRPRAAEVPVLVESLVQFAAPSRNVAEADSPNTCDAS